MAGPEFLVFNKAVYKDFQGSVYLSNVGIGTTFARTSLHIGTTDGVILPGGTELQRPAPVPGLIRYNTTTTQFEGYTSTGWGSIGGGAVSPDMLTYISASNDSNLRFYTGGDLRMVINPYGNVGIGLSNPDYLLDVRGGVSYIENLRTSNFNVDGDFRYAADGNSVRMTYQVSPTRYSEKLVASRSNFDVTVTGLYAVYACNVDIHVNGTKLGYISPTVGDYTVTYTTIENSNTFVQITTKTLIPEDNNIDILIYPSYLDGLGTLRPGYVEQNYTLTYWTKYDTTQNIYYNLGNVGIGTTYAVEQVHVEGDMWVRYMRASNFTVENEFYYANDGTQARMTYQVNPTRYTEIVSPVSGKSNFDVTVPGLYKVNPENVDIFINGQKLGYLNSNVKDYSVIYTGANDNTNTLVNITTAQSIPQSNSVNIVVYPTYINEFGYKAPGYLIQNYDLTYWQRYNTNCNIYYNDGNVGIGTTYAVEQFHVEGDMWVRFMRASNFTVENEFTYLPDGDQVRMTYQIAPTRYAELVAPAAGKSNFDVTVPGLYKVRQEDVDFFINGTRIGYLNSNINDYTLLYTGVNDNRNTLVNITTAFPVAQSNAVNITVYPSYLDDYGQKAPGYVVQNYDLTYWTRYNNTSNIYYNSGNVGIGTTAARELLHVEGDMYVNEIEASNVTVLANFYWGGETATTRRNFQVRPVTYTEKITDLAGKSNFTVSFDGLFAVNVEDVDVAVNGAKLAYISSNVSDYSLVYNNSTSNTTAFITIADLIAYDNIVDITVWPSYLPNQTVYQPGYAVLNVESSTYFGRTVGIGATSTLYNVEMGNVGIGTTVARSRLEVNGSILPSSCNVYDLGSSTRRWRDLYLSGSTIDLEGVQITSRNNELVLPNLTLNGPVINGYNAKDIRSYNYAGQVNLASLDADLKGFFGGFTDGRYGYFVPNYNGAYFGKVARINISPLNTSQL